MAVRVSYEYHDDGGQWFRAYGIDNWQFDAEGLMEVGFASIKNIRSPMQNARSTCLSAGCPITTLG